MGAIVAEPSLSQPRVIYNTARRYYVLLFKLTAAGAATSSATAGGSGGSGSGSGVRGSRQGWIGAAISVSPFGPFNWQHTLTGLAADDFALITSADGASACLLHSVPGPEPSHLLRQQRQLQQTADAAAGAPLVSTASPHQQLDSQQQQVEQREPQLPELAELREELVQEQGLWWERHEAGPEGSGYLAVTRLAPDFLSTMDEPPCASAPLVYSPAPFLHQGVWHVLGAKEAGSAPSSPVLLAAGSPGGPCGTAWSQLPAPASGAGAATTFDSRPAFVQSVELSTGEDLHVYWGDRVLGSGTGPGNATYVWLPLTPDTGGGDGLVLQNLPTWSIRDFEPKLPAV